MSGLSNTQRKALRYVLRNPHATPADAKVPYTTFVALSRRKLIHVGTTFASIAYPRTSAEATITPDGTRALRNGERT